MKLTSDWHIHSEHSCDCRGRGMTMRQIIDGATAEGVTDFGVADHLHSRFNRADLVASRAAFDACDAPVNFHFGVEVTCMRQWELDRIAEAAVDGRDDLAWGIGNEGPPGGTLAIDLTDDDVAELGIEYVIGAAHWSRSTGGDRTAIIDDYLRQYLFLAQHPLVDILGHPWWWASGFQDDRGGYSTLPWFDDFRAIPQSVHDELAAALVQTGTAAEINPGTLVTWHYPEPWRRQFLEYLAWLSERGVTLATGSDRHQRPYASRFSEMEPLLESVGIEDESLYRLPGRPR